MIDRVLSGAERWAIVCGDNLEVMRAMPPACVHLVYGDAPYFTNRDFMTDDGRPAYSDRWPSLDAFVANLRDRCAAARDLLTDDGTLVLQVDPETSHYVKVMLDGVFGRECYRNEIVWRYRKWGSPTPNFQRCHDVLLRYARQPARQRWNQLYEPRSASTLATWGDGRVISKTIDGKRVTVQTDEPSPGTQMSDVWEIPIVAPSGNERLGYPTQKPRALAERVIAACSHPGDVVLDPWSGSATHVSAAVHLGRSGIGIDLSPVAVEVGTARLRRETTQLDLFAGGAP